MTRMILRRCFNMYHAIP